MMKRRACPQNEAGPSQKRLADNTTKRKDTYKELYDLEYHDDIIWSGTVEIHDSQRIVFDCSIETFPQDEEIASLFPQKQLTIHSIPLSVLKSLIPHQKELRGFISSINEINDRMSYSAFCQAIRKYKDKVGCTVLKNSASALHLLHVYSISSGHEDYIIGHITTYQANDKVLGILRSQSLLPCVNPEHNELLKQNKMLKEELVRLHQEVDEQKKMAEKKQEELTTSQNERDMMKKAISEKDEKILVNDITMMENNEALMRKDREILSLQQKNLELQSEKEKVEEQLHRVLMKDRCLDADREINTEEDADKTLMMETSRLELQNQVTVKQAALDEIDRMMENDFKCSICSQLFIKTTTLICSHSFCAFCIQKWLSENGTCPHCRTRVTASVRSVVLDNLIETIVDKLGDEAKERRKVTVREREHDISVQEGGHLRSIPEDVDTEDETSTVSSPCSSLSHLSPSASLMSPYSCPPSSASTWSRSPASIANMFSPPSVLSTNSPSPACNGSNN